MLLRVMVFAGCETITWNFTRGLNDTQGALFVLNVGFLPAAGKLQQIQENSISRARLCWCSVLLRLERCFVNILTSVQSCAPATTQSKGSKSRLFHVQATSQAARRRTSRRTRC